MSVKDKLSVITYAVAKNNGGGGGGGTSNYNQLSNKPKINNVELSGNKTLASLGLGTSATLDVAATGDAGTTEVVKGDDSRLTDTRTPKAHSHAISDVTDLSTSLGNKVDKVQGKGLSTNDYDDTAKGIVDGATAAIAAKSTVSYTQTYTSSGQKIGEITIDGTTTDVVAPTGGGGSVTVEDNLTSTSATNALSANQGRVLKGYVDDINGVIPSTATTSNKLATASDIPDTSTLQPKTLTTTIGSYTTVEGALSGINGSLDGWTATATVDANSEVTFTGLSDSLGYSLYVEDKLAKITAITKTGSGSAVQLKYTLADVAQGDSCKLRIMR